MIEPRVPPSAASPCLSFPFLRRGARRGMGNRAFASRDAAVRATTSSQGAQSLSPPCEGGERKCLRGHEHTRFLSSFSQGREMRKLRGATGDARLLASVLLMLTILARVARTEELPPVPIDPRGHSGDVVAVAFAPDGKTLVTAGYDGVAKLWDIAAGKV